MKIHILLDNNTLIDRYFKGEPGVSYYIEDEGCKILFDTGYSDVFIENARKMKIDLLDLDYIAISHGHIDHTWGLVPLMRMQQEALIEKHSYKRPYFVAHSDVLKSKSYGDEDIGSVIGEETLNRHYNMMLSKDAYWMTNNIVFLGEIERSNNFEAQTPMGTYLEEGGQKADYLLDDSAIVYKSDDGLVIITGCSHAGICNIIEHAKKVCADDRILDVIGGFHLQNPSEEVLKKTVDYFKTLEAKEVHACHCTDLASKIALSKVSNLKEVGVGLVLEYK